MSSSRSSIRFLGVSFLESLIPSGIRDRSVKTTAAATTGPAQQPRPASSTPATKEYPAALASFSKSSMGVSAGRKEGSVFVLFVITKKNAAAR